MRLLVLILHPAPESVRLQLQLVDLVVVAGNNTLLICILRLGLLLGLPDSGFEFRVLLLEGRQLGQLEFEIELELVVV